MSFKRGCFGGVLIMTLVFVAMFLIIFMGLAGVVSRTYHQAIIQSYDETAFQIAESGLDYGRWRLAHSGEDFTEETREVKDQFAGTLGTYDVTFEPQAGSSIVLVESVGRTGNLPAREVTLRARYGMPSLAQYASLTNGDVWYGGEIHGPVHANGGIRMDGTSDSVVASARETYICQPAHGCNYEEKPGVWGTGELKELWEFPVPVVDYNAITLDLLDMKSIAQAAGTYYDRSGVYGYHIVFNDNNTYAIYRVTSKGPKVWLWFPETGLKRDSYDIGQETLLEVRSVPSDGVIYTEDTLWVEGDIRDRISVAAGRFPDTPSSNEDIIINGNISYGGVKDGTRSFGAVAQRHVLIPYSAAPDNLQLDGAFIAQKGRFGRHYYDSGAHRLKTSMVRYGMVASNFIPVTAWVDGSGQVISGYRQGQSGYDPNLLYQPPPHFPTTGQYQFISWEEVE
ncbi:MAG: hypothetical protein ABIH36_01790 [bacterium]